MNGDKTSGMTDNTGGDGLDRLLADDARAHRGSYVADDGFSARVMSALPPPLAPITLPAWRKPAVMALWGVAAAGLRWPCRPPCWTSGARRIVCSSPRSPFRCPELRAPWSR
jgi:hypothetical protein